MVAIKKLQLKALIYKEYLVHRRNLLNFCLIDLAIPFVFGFLLLVHIPREAELSVGKKLPKTQAFPMSYIERQLPFSDLFGFVIPPKMIIGHCVPTSGGSREVSTLNALNNSNLLVFPQNDETKQLMELFKKEMKEKSEIDIKIEFAKDRENFDERINKAVAEVTRVKILGGVVFHELNRSDHFVKYEIRPSLFRFNETLYQHPKYRFSIIEQPYIESHFIVLQMFINDAYLRFKYIKNNYNFTGICQLPDIDVFGEMKYLSANLIFNSAFVAAFLPLCVFTKRILDEKNNNTKQYLKQMSMRELEYWLSKVIIYTMLFVILAFYVICLLYYNTMESFDWSLMFAILMIYFISQLLFTMALTLFFNHSLAGLTAFIIIQLLFGYPIFKILKKPGAEEIVGKTFLGETDMSEIFYLIISLVTSPNLCLMIICELFVEGTFYASEAKHIGSYDSYTFKWVNIFTIPPEYDILCIAVLAVTLTVSAFIYLLFICFFAESKEILDKASKKVTREILRIETTTPKLSRKRSNMSNYFETDPVNLVPGIEITNVTKSFKDRSVVNEISLKLYFGQITVLLGHNGAGKTTLMSMISGMIQPTSGTIFIQGFNAVKEPEKALENVGLCPQMNILFENFTVEENLYIFGLLKGFSVINIASEITNVLKLIKLTEKRHFKAKALSGGMKRKLQLGIACIGGCKILILDEPSSGLDIESRRIIWDFLLSIRKKFLIFMTTHHMEEADCLGDRIIIMSEGDICCSGSSQFLKRAFSVGYHLRILTKKDKSAVHNFVKKKLFRTNVEYETIHETVFSFPTKQHVKLSEFFKELENKQDELGVISFGVNMMSLEDVFLRSVEILQNTSVSSNKSLEKFHLERPEKVSTFTIFKAILIKRVQTEVHRWQAFCVFVFLIALGSWVSFTLYILASKITKTSTPEWHKELNFTELGYTNLTGFCSSNSENSLCQRFVRIGDNFGIKIIPISNATTPDVSTVLQFAKIDYRFYREKVATGVSQIDKSIVLWYNRRFTHSTAVGINILYNSILQQFTNSDKSAIKASIHPPEADIRNNAEEKIHRMNREAYAIPFFLAFSVLLVAHFSSLIITSERVSKVKDFKSITLLFAHQAKLMQFMTGVTPLTYWIANYVFDIIYVTAATTPFWITIVTLGRGIVFYRSSYIYAMLAGFVAFILSSLSTNYVMSFICSKPTTAFAFLFIFSAVAGTVFNDLFLVAKFFSSNSDRSISAIVIFSLMEICARLSPFWTFAEVFIHIIRATNSIHVCNSLRNTTIETICQRPQIFVKVCCKFNCGDECFNEDYNPFQVEAPGVLFELASMLFIFVFCSFMIFLFENRFFSHEYCAKLQPIAVDDSDVLIERERVEKIIAEGGEPKEGLLCHQLAKIYRRCQPLKKILKHPKTLVSKLLAVNQISFSVHKSEIFGFLGVNGAGKTTTFRMLVGDLTPTSGNAFVSNFTLQKHFRQYQRQIGYCPQYDALLEMLSGMETLQYFATICGIPADKRNRIIDNIISLVDLERHATNISTFYSGGNKRKLSLAIAMIGCPTVLLLDEPTSGVDPSARRKLWNAIETFKVANDGSVILSSHSMNECESLCNRVGIIARGNLVCLGSIQHLKSKFCQGFTIHIKLKPKTSFDQMDKFVRKQLPQCKLSDDHKPLIAYSVFDIHATISTLFEVMENTKLLYDFEEYHITQTSLEQIFLSVSSTVSKSKSSTQSHD